MTADKMRALHPTARVQQLKNNQLFLVAYPRLILVISYHTLIAFAVDDAWHFCTAKISKSTDKHCYYLRELITIRHWYDNRRDLKQALKTVLPHITAAEGAQ